MRSISLTLLLITTQMSAADTLTAWLQEGKWDARFRLQYFATDWQDNTSTTGKGASDATGLAIGGSLNYKSGSLYGLSWGSTLYTTQDPNGRNDASDGMGATTSKDLFLRDSTRGTSNWVSTTYGQGYSVLGQTYLEYTLAQSRLKGGRFLMSNPWISPNDTKMIPLAIEGFQILSNDIPNTTLQFDYASRVKERGMSYFGTMADTADTPSKIASHYATHYNSSATSYGDDSPNVEIIGIKNHSIDTLELQAWGMRWNDLIDHYLVEGTYATELDDLIISLSGRYMVQNDQGAGQLILPKMNNADSDQSVDTSLFALRSVFNYGPLRWLLATSHTSASGDMIAPWRGFPSDGYTRSMTQSDWNANTRAYKTQLDIDLGSYLEGLSTSLSYAYYNRDATKKPYQNMTDRNMQNGDTHQSNLDILYKQSTSEYKIRLMDQRNATTALYPKETSNRELRLEANFYF